MPIEDVVHPFLKFYTAAPQWVKSTLGHLYALAPARLRYGAKYDEFVAEIAHCSDPAWLARRADEKLMATLRWAIDTVPAYAAYRGRQAASAEELLAAMPLLSKEAIKANPGSYLSSSMGPDTHLMSFTGGSTSVPMQLYLEKYVSRSKDFAYNTAFDQAAGIKGRTSDDAREALEKALASQDWWKSPDLADDVSTILRGAYGEGLEEIVQEIEAARIELGLTAAEIGGAGNVAYARGTYAFSMGPTAAMQAADSGKWLTVYEKQSDGSWRIKHNIWNSDQPLPAPAPPKN